MNLATKSNDDLLRVLRSLWQSKRDYENEVGHEVEFCAYDAKLLKRIEREIYLRAKRMESIAWLSNERQERRMAILNRPWELWGL